MAFSSHEGKRVFQDWLSAFTSITRDTPVQDIKTILDIGPGAGVYCDLIRHVEAENGSVMHVTGLEVFEPYVERFNLKSKYNRVIVENASSFFMHNEEQFDLIIFGDVLEHFAFAEALDIYRRALKCSKFVFISIPLHFDSKPWFPGYEQTPAEWEENKHEQHLLTINVEQFFHWFGPFTCNVHLRVVSIFIAEGSIPCHSPQ